MFSNRRIVFAIIAMGAFVIVVLVAIVLIRNTPKQAITSQHITNLTTASSTHAMATSSPSKVKNIGFIYDSQKLLVSASQFKQFSTDQLVLYNFITGATTTLKLPNGSFTHPQMSTTWETLNGGQVLLPSMRDVDNTHTKLTVWNMSKYTSIITVFAHTPNAGSYSSVAYSPRQNKLAYCGPNGGYVVTNLQHLSSKTFANSDIVLGICQIAYSDNPPRFSSDGQAIYFGIFQTNEYGNITTGIEQIRKLNLKNGSMSYVTETPYSTRGFNTEGTRYFAQTPSGFAVYNTSNINIDHLTSTKIIQLAPIISLGKLSFLPREFLLGNIAFTQDGNGVFYEVGGANALTTLGYFDIIHDINYYPIPLPQTHYGYIKLLGAYNKRSLFVDITAQPFQGSLNTISGRGNEIGKNLLYKLSYNGSSTLIDSSKEAFSPLLFVKGK